MSGTSLWSWETTAAGNDTGGALFPEGQSRASVNNSARAIQATIRQWANDAQWLEYGDGSGPATISFDSATSFVVSGVDVTGVYHAGRRVKADGSATGTIYGTITSSSFSIDTTVNVEWDSGSLQNETLTIWIGALSRDNPSVPRLASLELEPAADGSDVLTIRNAAGDDRIVGAIAADGSGDVDVRDASGTTRAALVSASGQIQARDASGNTTARLDGVDESFIGGRIRVRQPSGSRVLDFENDAGETWAQIFHRATDDTLRFQTRTAADGAVGGDLRLGPTAGTLFLNGDPVTAFPSGTKMLFAQTTAPAGWTKDTDVNDRLLRVVSGSGGGGTGGSWTISGLTVAGHALTEAEMPSHEHALLVRSFDTGGVNDGTRLSAANSAGTTGTQTTQSTGSGTSHTHGISHSGGWRPAHLDLIKCTRS